MTEEDLLEMEKRFTRMDNPCLIAEVRELQRDVRVIRGAAELSAQECLNLRGQLAELRAENQKLKQDGHYTLANNLVHMGMERDELRSQLAEAKDLIKQLDARFSRYEVKNCID